MNLYQLTSGVSQTVAEAVDKSVRAYLADLEKTYQQRRDASRVARGRLARRFEPWTESYPIQVTHRATVQSRECLISIDGCPIQVKVYPNVPLWDWNNRRRSDASWSLAVIDQEGGHLQLLANGESDFESLVQRGIITMIGYAYTDAMSDTSAKRSRTKNKG